MGKSCVAIDTLIFERVSLDQKMAGKQGFRSQLSGNWNCQMEEKVALAYSGSGNF